MASVGTVWANLNLNISDFTSKLAQASQDIKRFAVKQSDAFEGGTAKVNAFTKSLEKASRQVGKGKNGTKELASYMRKLSEIAKGYDESTLALGRHNLGLRDMNRIVQGIVVASVFYNVVGAINEATSAMWEFNKSIDYAQITYSALFGDKQTANEFLDVLQQYSIDTVFDYDGLADASKKLAAYGIPYKNMMYVMEGLTNLTTLTGDAAALDRIAYALGQIYAKGKLSAEEMRQLANAYVPIQKILTDKMGLSGDQLKNVGKLGISAADSINAIIDYANEQFGAMADAAMYTITGLENRIVDTIKVAGAAVLQPATIFYKSFLAYVVNILDMMRAAIDAQGVKGLFEFLVPDPQLQTIIRTFVANVQNMLMTLVSIGLMLGNVLGNVAYTLMTAFNMMAPTILFVVNVLGAVLNAFLQTRVGATILRYAVLAAAAAFIVLRVHALATLVIQAVTKVIYGLAQALLILSTIIARHPIIMLMVALGAALTGVAVSSKSANSALGSLFNTISKAVGGVGYGDVFEDTSAAADDATDAYDKFNNKLEDTGDAAADATDKVDKTGDAAKKAADKAKKATKSLLSFDEVFRLNDPTDTSSDANKDKTDTPKVDTGVLGDLEKLAEGFSGLGESLIPEIPDFSDFLKGFTDGLFGGLEGAIGDRLKDATIGALLGAGIGAIIGGLVGQPAIGAAIGALAGFIVGFLWDDIQNMLELSDTQGVTAGIAGAIGAVIGGIAGGPAGAAIGAAIGILGSFVTSSLWNGLAEAFELDEGSADRAAIGTVIGAAIGGILGSVIGGPPGAIIGAAIGALAGGVAGLIWSSLQAQLENKPEAQIELAIGTAIGAVLGGVLGGPVGAVIGGAIGSLASGLSILLWSTLAEKLGKDDSAVSSANVGSTIGTLLGGAIGALLGGPPGAIIGAAIGNFAGGFVGLFWDEITAAFKRFGSGFIEPFKEIGSWWEEHVISYFSEAKKAFDEQDWGELGLNILSGIINGIIGALTLIPKSMVALFQGIWNGICEVFGIASPAKEMKPLGEFIGQGILEGILGVFTGIGEWINTHIFEPIRNAFGNFSIAGLLGNIGDKITITATVALEKAKEWSSEAWEALHARGETVKRTLEQAVVKSASWMADAWEAVGMRAENVKRTLEQAVTRGATWASDAWEAVGMRAETVKRTLEQAVTKGATWVSDAWDAVGKRADTIKRTLEQSVKKGGAWTSDAWDAANKAASTIKRTLEQAVKKGGTWTSDAWDAANKASATIRRTLEQSVKKGSSWIADAWSAVNKAAGTTKRTLAQSVKKGSTWVSDAWEAAKKTAGTVVRTLVQTVTGSKKADGGVYAGGKWHNIAAYANGGTPDTGQFFLARENGPELVGTLNGHTAVMNNDQIVSSVSSGVYSAVSSAIGGVSSMSSAILNKIVDASNSIVSAIGTVGISSIDAIKYNSTGVLSRDDLGTSTVTYDTQNYTQDDLFTFANAVVDGIVAGLSPQLATVGAPSTTTNDLPPVYVGTLIADERGLRELERKMRIIRVKEERRGI